MKRYRLTGIAQIDGEVRGPGYEFTLPDGMHGPCVTKMVSCDLHASSIDAITDGKYEGPCAARFVDVPIYEEIEERPLLPAPIREMLALVDKLGERDV